MPRRLRIRVKTSFGDLLIEGNDTKEILDMLKDITPEFTERIDELVSSKLRPVLQPQLTGIVELTTEGPVIASRGRFTHYEAIGLVLYASEGGANTASQIDRLLLSSGVKSMVPARLNEMTKRGLVFKPDPKRPEFKLTTQGRSWVEEVVAKLRSQTSTR